jgi:RimJ/RimL family protein N-acetyltransferase
LSEESKNLPFKAIDTDTGETIGHVELLSIDRSNRSLTIGSVLIGPSELRGRGAGRALILAALRIAFDDLEMHRVDLGVFDFNTSAIACYEHAGFQREGVLRDHRRVGNQYWTLIMMSIMEDEWRAGGEGGQV